MATLYVTEQGSVVHKKSERFVVTKDGGVILELPSVKVDSIAIFGNVQLTTQTIVYVLKRGIDVTFLSSNGSYYGMLQSPCSENPQLRQKQVVASMDHDFALEVSKRFVTGKISNQRVLLLRFLRKKKNDIVENCIKKLEEILERISVCETIDSVRGCEGLAAVTYYRAFGQLLEHGFQFNKRQRRPPKDPANSLLSFGYTLLVYNVTAGINVAGLDPYIGFFHQPRPGKTSLALDLMEEFRPIIVDSLVFRVINSKILKLEDFYHDENRSGIFLTDEARKKFLAEYERRVLTTTQYSDGKTYSYRQIFELQARALARAIRNGAKIYKPMVVR